VIEAIKSEFVASSIRDSLIHMLEIKERSMTTCFDNCQTLNWDKTKISSVYTLQCCTNSSAAVILVRKTVLDDFWKEDNKVDWEIIDNLLMYLTAKSKVKVYSHYVFLTAPSGT
jgi:hypothetical protein